MTSAQDSLTVLGTDPVCLIGSFLGDNDILSMSYTNRRYFDALEHARVTKRQAYDDEGEVLNDTFEDLTSRLKYYHIVESFEYKITLGRLQLEVRESVFLTSTFRCEHLRKVLRGPVLEHLLTLCGSDLRLARNVQNCYVYLYQLTSLLQDSFWLDHDRGLRLNADIAPEHLALHQRCLVRLFDDHFKRDAFQGLEPSKYVSLIQRCASVFTRIQCDLSLRMRTPAGKCELGECMDLLERMHMSSNVSDFVAYLRSEHRMAANEGVLEQDLPNNISSMGTSYLYTYDYITPVGIYMQRPEYTYETTPQCYNHHHRIIKYFIDLGGEMIGEE